MSTFTGNPVRFTALKPTIVEGKPVTFSAPRAWIMRATPGGLRPAQLSRATSEGIEELTPAP